MNPLARTNEQETLGQEALRNIALLREQGLLTDKEACRAYSRISGLLNKKLMGILYGAKDHFGK